MNDPRSTFARALFAVVLLAAPALAQAPPRAAAAPARPATTAVSHEILTVTTPDGLQLPAVLATPVSGFDPLAPAIVHIPDGPGLSPLKSDAPARFLTDGLAGLGYPNLALETRLTARYAFSRFDESITDVKAALDALAARGTSSFILVGTGLGALVAARYLIDSEDPRVRALVMVSPTEDLPDGLRRQVGEERARKMIDDATRAVNEGERDFVDLGQGRIFTPAAFLDWFGPQARTSLLHAMARIDRPLLLLAGANDPRNARARLDALKGAARLTKVAGVQTYINAGADLGAQKQAITTDIWRWLGANDLAPPPRIQTQLVTATAADGTKLEGVLYRPASGGDTLRPAFVLAHGWASDVMRSTSHWLAQRLAQKGFAVLSMQHRGSGFRGTVSGKLEDVPQDIAAWSALMGGRGYRNLVGLGHAVGSLWLSEYWAQTKDPRFKAMVYLAPMRDLPRHARLAMGEDRYARTVLEADEAVRDGKGATHLIDAPFPQTVYEEDPRQPMFLSAPGSGFTYYYADAFLSYWGPKSKAMHTQLIKQVNLPILALGGSRDPMMQGAFLIEFTQAAGANARYIFYGGPGGAAASFEGFESRVTADIVRWIDQAL